MNKSIIVALVIAVVAVTISGLIAIPAIDQAHARSSTAVSRDKGQQGDSASGGKRGGTGGGDCPNCG